jgi:hypothetical protein
VIVGRKSVVPGWAKLPLGARLQQQHVEWEERSVRPTNLIDAIHLREFGRELHAEFVAFDIGHRDPGMQTLSPVTDDGGATINEPATKGAP